MMITILFIIIFIIVLVCAARIIDKSWHKYGDILGNDKDNTEKLDKIV